MVLDSLCPGVQIGEMASKRSTSIEIRCKSIRFAPTGRSWAAATTEGLLIYSLDDRLVFDPFDLDLDTTPKNIRQTLANGHHLKALVVPTSLLFVSLSSLHPIGQGGRKEDGERDAGRGGIPKTVCQCNICLIPQMALRLNEEELIGEVYHAVPPHQIQLTAAHLPDHHLQRFMQFIGKVLCPPPFCC